MVCTKKNKCHSLKSNNMPHPCTLLLLLILSFSFANTGAATCYGDGTKTIFGMSCQQILDEHDIDTFCNQPSLKTSCCQSWESYCERQDGVCDGDFGPAVLYKKTCQQFLNEYDTYTFCNQPKLKTSCCQSWENYCEIQDGVCKGDFGPAVLNRKTCQEFVNELGIDRFCIQPKLKTSCCGSMAKYCERQDGVCNGDFSPAVYKRMTCSELLRQWGEDKFCLNEDIVKDKCCQTWKDHGCDYFKCEASEEKIPNEKLCDKVNDCRDGSDEGWEECYQCHDGSFIRHKFLCNGKEECPDGSDEGTNGTCIMCDGRQEWGQHMTCDHNLRATIFPVDCHDGSDEIGCQGNTDVPGNYVVEVLVVIDSEALKRYLHDHKSNKVDAKKAMLKELDYFLTEANKHYANFFKSGFKMKVSKRKVLFLEDGDILWPNQRSDHKGKPRMSHQTGVNLFTDYLRKTEAKLKYNYDHAVLFTGYDIEDGDTKNPSVLGIANVGKACDTQGNAMSFVEWSGDYKTAAVFVHELAHSLGSRHDPAKYTNFIMAGSTHFEDDRWWFSEISRHKINNYIRKLNKLKMNCLIEEGSPGGYDIPNAEITPELADPNILCSRKYGPRWFYEPKRTANGMGIASGNSLCNNLQCWDGLYPYIKFVHTSDGMACDEHKACNEGRCEASSSQVAKNANDGNCLFGDYKLKGFCANAVKRNLRSFCANEQLKGKCCASAAIHCNKANNGRSLVRRLIDTLKGAIHEKRLVKLEPEKKTSEEPEKKTNEEPEKKRSEEPEKKTSERPEKKTREEPTKKTNEKVHAETAPKNKAINSDDGFKFEVTSEPLQEITYPIIDITYPIIVETQELLPNIVSEKLLPDITEKTEIAEDR